MHQRLVGFDNIEMGAAHAYGLTTYEQPAEEMIDMTVAMITRKRAAEPVILAGRLVPRLSA
jgi:DNA-binding LacI/PurR family transcriptional regulator